MKPQQNVHRKRKKHNDLVKSTTNNDLDLGGESACTVDSHSAKGSDSLLSAHSRNYSAVKSRTKFSETVAEDVDQITNGCIGSHKLLCRLGDVKQGGSTRTITNGLSHSGVSDSKQYSFGVGNWRKWLDEPEPMIPETSSLREATDSIGILAEINNTVMLVVL